MCLGWLTVFDFPTLLSITVGSLIPHCSISELQEVDVLTASSPNKISFSYIQPFGSPIFYLILNPSMKKHEKCSTSFIIKVSPIKTTLIYHYKMAKIKKTDNSKCRRWCDMVVTYIHHFETSLAEAIQIKRAHQLHKWRGRPLPVDAQKKRVCTCATRLVQECPRQHYSE